MLVSFELSEGRWVLTVRSSDTATTASNEAASREAAIARQMFRLRSIGPEFPTFLPAECFHREFGNRRQVAAFAVLDPTPWASGSVEREQGTSKAGNRRGCAGPWSSWHGRGRAISRARR